MNEILASSSNATNWPDVAMAFIILLFFAFIFWVAGR